MKKFFLLWMLIPLLSSCIIGGTTTEDPTRIKTISVTVNASDWKYTQQSNYDQFNNNYFYAVVEMPELTSRIFDQGVITAYLVKDRTNKQYARKHQLPYVMHVEEEVATGHWNYYTETVDFTYGIGWAEFNYRASDFAYEDNESINPVGMEFDIVITYKN